jgi:hypothetical protein
MFAQAAIDESSITLTDSCGFRQERRGSSSAVESVQRPQPSNPRINIDMNIRNRYG